MLKRIRDAFNKLIELGIFNEESKLSRTIDENAAAILFLQMVDDLPVKKARDIPDDISALIEELESLGVERIVPGKEIIVEENPNEVETKTFTEDEIRETQDAKTTKVGNEKAVDYFKAGAITEKLEYLRSLSEPNQLLEMRKHIDVINASQKREKPIIIHDEADFLEAREIFLSAIESSMDMELPIPDFSKLFNNMLVDRILEEDSKNPAAKQNKEKSKAKPKSKKKSEKVVEKIIKEEKTMEDKKKPADLLLALGEALTKSVDLYNQILAEAGNYEPDPEPEVVKEFKSANPTTQAIYEYIKGRKTVVFTELASWVETVDELAAIPSRLKAHLETIKEGISDFEVLDWDVASDKITITKVN